jgi:hypothetical protein
MLGPLLTTCALLLTATALAYVAWRTYHKRRARRVYTVHMKEWEIYPNVDPRPLHPARRSGPYTEDND